MGKKIGPDQKNYVEWYIQETGKTEIDMHDVARWLISKGYKVKPPMSEVDMLARQLSKQAREQTRTDSESGSSYRAYHAFTQRQGDVQLTLWVDIDKAPRKPMERSMLQRREQMVGDGVQLSLDLDHWNRIHPTEEPIKVDFDLTDDIEWRKNAPKEDDDDEAA